jgi:hypothetical protein
MSSILNTNLNTSRNTKKEDPKGIQNSSVEEELYEQESGEGAADKSVSWPEFGLGVRCHGALLLGHSGLSSHSYSRSRRGYEAPPLL